MLVVMDTDPKENVGSLLMIDDESGLGIPFSFFVFI